MGCEPYFVELDLEFIRETDEAIFVTDSVREVWLPKSVCCLPHDFEHAVNGDVVTIQVAEFMAIEKELI